MRRDGTTVTDARLLHSAASMVNMTRSEALSNGGAPTINAVAHRYGAGAQVHHRSVKPGPAT